MSIDQIWTRFPIPMYRFLVETYETEILKVLSVLEAASRTRICRCVRIQQTSEAAAFASTWCTSA
jgi:hypothetical protein